MGWEMVKIRDVCEVLVNPQKVNITMTKERGYRFTRVKRNSEPVL